MSKRGLKIGLSGILCLGFLSMKAQEELSLSDAIQKALKNNYDISIVNANTEMASNLNNQGLAGRWPSLSFNLNQNNTANDQIQTASPFQPKGIILNSSLAPTLSLNWMLFEGFKANITKSRYDKLQMESEGNASIVVSNTIQAVVMAYYLVELETERLEVFRKTMQLSFDRYQQVTYKKEFGSAVTSDMLLEEGNYLTDSVNCINQELAVRSSVRVLNELMAEKDLEKKYKLTDKLEVKNEIYDLAAMEQKMLEQNADLKTKYISQSVVKEDMRLARAERYPKLQLNANATNSWGRVDQSNALYYNISTEQFNPPLDNQKILTSESRTYAVGFSLTYNLFNGRRINTAVKNALIREDISNMEVEKMELGLKADLHDNYDNYTYRKSIYDINQRKREVSQTNLGIMEDRFKRGAVNSFDYRTVQVNYLTAALQELNARYGLMESKIALMRLSGTILEVYQ